MEAFGVVATAVQLGDIAFRVFKALAGFVNDAKTADTAARELRDKVEALWRTVKSVKRVMDIRDNALQTRILALDELRLRKTLAKDMSVCYRVLEQFELSLEGLLHDRASPSWLGKSLLQLQLDKRDGAIKRFENFIDTRLQMLQVSLACLEVLMNVGNHREVINRLDELSFAIDQIQDSFATLQKTPKQLVGHLEPTLSEAELQGSEDELQGLDSVINEVAQGIESDFKGLLVEAREVHRSTTGSVRGQTETSSDSSLSFHTQARHSPPALRLSQTVGFPSVESIEPQEPSFDPTPDFDNTTHIEPLEELIDRLTREAAECLRNGLYNNAERHQREAIALLEERHVGHGRLFDNYWDMQTILADILSAQRKHDESDTIRFALLQGQAEYIPVSSEARIPFEDAFPDSTKALRFASEYFKLAKGYFQRYQQDPNGPQAQQFMKVAEMHAKRAFKCRRHFTELSDHQFVTTVELLIAIYDCQMRTVYADVYRRKYVDPQDRPPSPSLCSVSPRSSMSRVDAVANPGLRQGRSQPRSVYSVESHPRQDSVFGHMDPLEPVRSLTSSPDEPKASADKQSVKKLVEQAVKTNDQRNLLPLVDRNNAGNGLADKTMLNYALFIAAEQGSTEMVDWLLNRDADPNSCNKYLQTPLHIAAQRGNLSVVQQLLDRHADPNKPGSDGWTVLHFAVHGNQKDVLRSLLHTTHKADVNARCRNGNTGLHVAAEHGNFEVASVLIQAGADATIRNEYEQCTALEIAMNRREDKFVQAWLRAGLPCDVRWELVARSSPYIKRDVKKHLAGLRQDGPEGGSTRSATPPPTSPRSTTRSRTESFGTHASGGSSVKKGLSKVFSRMSAN